MKKIISIGVIAAVCAGAVIFSQIAWSERVEETAETAGETRPADEMTAEDNGTDSDGEANSSENGGSSSSNTETNSSSPGSGSSAGSRGESSSVNEENAADGPAGSELDEQEILDTYFEQYETMQAQETERLEQILANAETDYQRVQSGDLDRPANDVQADYIQRVNVLEEEADQRFNDLHNQVRTALEENGYDPDKAEEFELLYETQKETRRLEAVHRIFDQ
ncbi:hypothetical protein [Alkalicoccus halolimnae]|uniref:DUF4168 domain-containing protein n=1 Tax=Alkalicoccus halolimnae TaxID=1667239 RepID=A0A5C7FNT0_9BACI|nr:hypothetical protein [Alkalicoccus halolimnae]TXF86996.1 hypothetical protein FTX54_03460 [Alkalicoccus halolimnae]